jgi:predicted RNase H-like HicB family nuclease
MDQPRNLVKSVEEALENIKEAIALFMEDNTKQKIS